MYCVMYTVQIYNCKQIKAVHFWVKQYIHVIASDGPRLTLYELLTSALFLCDRKAILDMHLNHLWKYVNY